MRKENFNLFFAKRSRLLKSGEAAIFMRIIYNGTRIETNTGKTIEPNLWNQAKERAKGTLDYYEDGKHIGVYNRKGIENDCRLPSKGHGQLTKKILRALHNAPPEWKEDGYESAEDWYYDKEENLYLYYGR